MACSVASATATNSGESAPPAPSPASDTWSRRVRARLGVLAANSFDFLGLDSLLQSGSYSSSYGSSTRVTQILALLEDEREREQARA